MKKNMKRKTYKTIAIVVVIIIIFSFTAINIATKPETVGTDPSVKLNNVFSPCMYNNTTEFLYSVGYVNFTGFGNNVTYIYGVLPVGGSSSVPLNFQGGFIDYCLFKIKQDVNFPFTNTSLYVHVTFQPYKYLNSYANRGYNSPNIRSQVYHYPRCFIGGGGGGPGGFSGDTNIGIHKFYVNMTLTPVFDINIYHIPGKSKTLHFVFNVNVTKRNTTS